MRVFASTNGSPNHFFSPELLADSARDYSVYVLDPLESSSNDGNSSHVFDSLTPDAQVTSSNSSLSLSPGGDGISIGMGLLSWCLSDDRNNARRTGQDNEEGYVIGKLVKDRGADALEVVMSLREVRFLAFAFEHQHIFQQTASQTQRQHALSLSSWGFPAGSTAPPLVEHTSSSTIPSPVRPTPCPLPPHDSRICPQSSTASTSFLKDRLLELVGTSMSRSASSPAPNLMSSPSQSAMPSSTTPATAVKRLGRPPGTRMHPEKRARRIAIESHREKLEKMENIAKGQRGEAYDKTLVVSSELEGPKVTDDDIARQQKTLEELESRPLIVDQSSCLTTEPLPKRTVSPTSIVPLSKQVDNVAPKRKGRSNKPTNAAASGSNQHAATAVTQLPSGSMHGVTGDQPGAGLLLSLLACVLGNVDEPSIAGMTPVADAGQNDTKGKTKTPLPVDNALTGALQRLLPLLSTNVSRSAAPLSTSASSLVQHAGDTRTCTSGALQSKPPQPQKGQRLFKTTEETFYSDVPHGPNWPRDNHWAAGKSMPSEKPTPKVREEAYPVPGGGWARGRSLVPRDSAPRASPADTSRDMTMRTNTLTTLVASEKENKSRTKTVRGLKRSLSNGVDAKENATTSNVARQQTSTKKRKQESASGVKSNAVKSQGTTRAVMGSAQNNKADLSQQSGMMFTASSPGRTAPMNVDRSLPVVAMSEPDYFSPGLPARPVVAPESSSPELPKTPPRRGRLSDDGADGSLFTPCAPASATQLVGNAMSPADGLLFSPSPVAVISRGNHVEAGSRPPATAGHSQNQSNGWDLPPSSPPPATSPISPHTDLGAEQGMDFEFVSQLLNELNSEMEQADARFEDHGTTINRASASAVTGGLPPSLAEGPPSDEPLSFQTPATSSDFDPLSDGTFDFGELGQFGGEEARGQGIELDINELWSSLGPVIVQAQAESNTADDQFQPSSPHEDFGIFGLGSDQTHVESQVQGGVDAVKLAEDLKSLFGGCVV